MTPRAARAGVVAAAALAVAYALVVGLASGSVDHLADQARQDWYLLVPIVGAFGLQVGLMSELRRRHRLRHAAMAAGGTGTAGSVAGMVACCAHHLADLAPFLAAGGAATFLYERRAAFMLGGLAVNAVGVAIAVRRLRRLPSPRSLHLQGTMACAASS